jgi:hypothetical protein
MKEELDIAAQLLDTGKLLEAQSWFQHILLNTDDELEERICENRLKDIEKALKALRAVSTISICSSGEEKTRIDCVVKLTSPDESLRGLAEQIFIKIHKKDYGPDSSVSFDRQGNAAILSLSGMKEDARCTICLKFRNQIMDNLGKDGCLEEGSCPIGRSGSQGSVVKP